MVGLYIEGGGDSKYLHIEFRRAFSAFLEKAGLRGDAIRPRPCGSRNKAYDRFCTAIEQEGKAFLLVDSESPVDAALASGQPENWQPWEHLYRRDGWTKPSSSSDTDCHLMVQIMESWFLADKETLADFFGQGFQKSALPTQNVVETVDKEAVLRGLEKASRKCKTKAPYKKGTHSFKILALIDPQKVCSASPWAKRFIGILLGHH
jgi:hypothetical protein